MSEDTAEFIPAPKVDTPPSPAKMAFLAALAKAQGDFLPVVRNRTVTIQPGADSRARGGQAYTFAYAELSEVIEKTRPALAANGLSFRNRVLPHDNGTHVWVESILAHAEGYEDVCAIGVLVGDDPKQFGGRVSYVRRIMGTAQLGVASEDDEPDDGSGGGDTKMGGTAGRTQARAKPQPAARPAAAKAAAPAAPQEAPPTEGQAEESGNVSTGALIGPGQVKWLQNKLGSEFEEAAERDAFLAKHGVTDDLMAFTESQFQAVRAALLAR